MLRGLLYIIFFSLSCGDNRLYIRYLHIYIHAGLAVARRPDDDDPGCYSTTSTVKPCPRPSFHLRAEHVRQQPPARAERWRRGYSSSFAKPLF